MLWFRAWRVCVRLLLSEPRWTEAAVAAAARDRWLCVMWRRACAVLQVIQLLRDAFQQAGLPAYLRPYGCLPTGYERGVIEVVPDTNSRCAPVRAYVCGFVRVWRCRGVPATFMCGT